MSKNLVSKLIKAWQVNIYYTIKFKQLMNLSDYLCMMLMKIIPFFHRNLYALYCPMKASPKYSPKIVIQRLSWSITFVTNLARRCLLHSNSHWTFIISKIRISLLSELSWKRKIGYFWILKFMVESYLFQICFVCCCPFHSRRICISKVDYKPFE
jgi:hypothetical protein